MTGATAILDLERAGFTRDQVEALARWGEGQSATKADIAEAVADLRAEIVEVRHELKADIARVEAGMDKLALRMTVTLGGLIVAGVVGLGAFLKLFPGAHP